MLICVIGAGWYGCITAQFFLDKGHKVIIYEQNEIFSGASFANQNRLHLGFHYARNFATRNLCKQSFEWMKEHFGFAIKEMNYNYYCVSNQSLLDANTYLDIFRNYTYDIIKDPIIDVNESQIIINTKECYINHKLVKEYWSNKLHKHLIQKQIFPDDIKKVLTSKFDFVFDCTNSSIYNITNTKSELAISFIYKNTSELNAAITVVDGNFCSLYPYDLDNHLYTLTSVLHTPIHMDTTIDNELIESKRNNMEDEIMTYVPKYFSNFEYVSYFISKKVKPNYKDDRRTLVHTKYENFYQVCCCKISGIVEWLNVLQKEFN